MFKNVSLKTKISTSLLITIPLLISVLVLGAGLYSYYVVQQFFTKLEFVHDIQQFNPIFSVLRNWVRISTLAAAILGLLLAYTITLPLKKLTETTKSVGSGDFTKSVQISSSDEIGALGKSFNEMVSSINEHIIESMTGGIITINMQGQITTLNTAAELILGYDSKEIIGKSFSVLLANPDANKQFMDIIKMAIKNNQTTSSKEININNKAGKKVLIGITTSLLKDKNNTMLGIIASFKDLGKIKHLEEQMRRADRLAAVGSLAAGVAHEIRNPLGSVKGLVQLLQEDIPADDPKRSYAEVIVREVDRLNKVVEDLLSFAKSDEKNKEETLEIIDINAVLNATLELTKHDTLNIKIKVDTRYDQDLPKVRGDFKKLQQAFLNIIFNAFHAMEQGGVLTITTQKSQDADFAEIHFRDTGKGIDPEIMHKLFDPFFTTRKGGTGLGLTITHQIITSHKGKIDVHSEPEKGAEFIIALPVMKGVKDT